VVNVRNTKNLRFFALLFNSHISLIRSSLIALWLHAQLLMTVRTQTERFISAQGN